MGNKIVDFFREYIFIFSILVIIFGLFVLFIGIFGMWYDDFLVNTFNVSRSFIGWSLYLLIIGIIVLLVGVWYLYSFLKNKKFILEEIDTNKRSEFLKKHTEIKKVVRNMPSRYKTMFEDKEKELKIK